MGPIAKFAAGVVVPLLIAVVLIVMGASSPGEFLTVRICIGIAATAIFWLTIQALCREAYDIWHYVAGAAVMALVVVVVPNLYRWVDDKERAAQASQYTGTLRPKVEPIFSPFGADGIHVAHIELGDSGVFFDRTDRYGRAMFPFLERDQFKVELIDGHYKFSTQLRDEKGDLIAEIKQNDWQVAVPPQTFDKNYNDSTLEVRDAHGDIVLQVHMLPDRMQIQGVWSTPEFFWKRIAIFAMRTVNIDSRHGKSWMTYDPMITSVENNQKSPLDPWFLYPSKHHFGELTDLGKLLK